mmetsp:Transcript_7198/g.13431  ORF Transcript_7198/g.13431 Transcript_7198/m.13431 type:complete len:115 (+) Transcript_7198:196-540(+)
MHHRLNPLREEAFAACEQASAQRQNSHNDSAAKNEAINEWARLFIQCVVSACDSRHVQLLWRSLNAPPSSRAAAAGTACTSGNNESDDTDALDVAQQRRRKLWMLRHRSSVIVL